MAKGIARCMEEFRDSGTFGDEYDTFCQALDARVASYM